MSNIKFYKEKSLPLEMHKVRIVQKLNLLPIDERLKAIIYDLEEQKKKTIELENNYNQKLTVYEKESKLAHSKVNRLHAKCNRLSLFILITYILIITLGAIIYFKLFK